MPSKYSSTNKHPSFPVRINNSMHTLYEKVITVKSIIGAIYHDVIIHLNRYLSSFSLKFKQRIIT